MKNTFETSFTITQSEAGLRIDALCAQKFPDISRSRWQKAGTFMLAGIEKPGKTKVRAAEVWNVVCHIGDGEIALSHLQEWDFPLHVLAESESWVVIEKPEGISVHPSSSERSQQTIVNALVHQFQSLSDHADEIDGQTVPRPGLVHRLDKVTSGCLLVAKTNQAHVFFQNQWKNVNKVYYALVHGQPPAKGRIEAGLLRDSRDRTKMAVSKDERSKEAVTRFVTVETKSPPSPSPFPKGGDVSLLKIRIPTGRTHQIRVHLSSIGYPIVGDEKYGGAPAERVFLHAAELHFPDPDQDGVFVTVTSPLPELFSRLPEEG